MGAQNAVPEEVIVTVGKYLTPTQARVALCVTRVDANAVEGVYTHLSNHIEVEATGKASPSRLRKMDASKTHAVSQAFSSHDTYWAIQQHVCELCCVRKSCSRERCSHCVNIPTLKLPSKQIDICCSCNRAWLPRDAVEQRKQEIVTAATWWQMAAPLSPVPLPSECVRGYDHGGLLVRRRDFELQETAFWESVQEARADRREKQRVLQRIREQLEVAEHDMEFAYVLLSDQSKAEDRILRWTWLMLQSHLDNWRRVPLDQEPRFFKYEELVVNFIGRGMRLLQATERFEMEIYNVINKTMLRDVETRAMEAGVSSEEVDTWTSFGCLDCISVILLDKPMSHVPHQNEKLKKALSRQLVAEEAFPAFHEFQDIVQGVRIRLQCVKYRHLVDFVELEVEFRGLQAQTVLELWCSNPGAVGVIAASARGRRAGTMWDEVIAALEAVLPRREEAMEALVQSFQESHQEAPPRRIRRREADRALDLVDDGQYGTWSRPRLVRHLQALGESTDGIHPTLVARMKYLKRCRDRQNSPRLSVRSDSTESDESESDESESDDVL